MSAKRRSWLRSMSSVPILAVFLVVGLVTAGSSGVDEGAGVGVAPPAGGPSGELPAYMPGEVIVKLNETSGAGLSRLEHRYGLRARGAGGEIGVASGRQAPARPRRRGVHVLKTDADVHAVCAALRNDPAVAYAQPNYVYKFCRQPDDPDFPDQYAHQLIQMPDAWDISTGSHDVVVAVLGTGVDVNHPDLKDNIWVNEGEVPSNGIDDDENGYVDDIHGWNFEADNNDVTPEADFPFPWFSYDAGIESHETQVAGVIAAVGNNGLGVCGVNWKCRIMALRVSLYITSEEVVAGLEYATANGADVLNMSFGSDEFGPEGDPIVREAIDDAYAAGVLLTASAGNDDTGRPHYPAAYHNVMAVSSTNGEDIKTGHSSFGRWVDIAAPGTDIVTTDMDGEYIATAGTSFSAPYVAAVGALVLAHRPDLTHVQVRAILENTSDPIWYGDVETDAAYLGTGRVNAYEALVAADEAHPLGEIVAPLPSEVIDADGNDLTVTVFVHGDSYELDYRGYEAEEWAPLADGSAVPDANGMVSVSVPQPATGVYELELRVSNSGNVHTDRKVFGIGSIVNQSPWPVPDVNDDEGFGELFLGSPLCLDADGDGQNEVIASSLDLSSYWSDGKTYIWEANGVPLPGWPVELESFLVTGAAVGDVDGDADYELVGVDEYGIVCVWNIDSATIADGNWPRGLGSWSSYIVSPPVLADLDSDGDSEIIIALNAESGETDGLYAIQGDGTFLWERRYTTEGPISAADLDGDGDVEIALCGFGPGITRVYTYILNHDGQTVKKWRGGSDRGTVVADVDADGTPEVIYCTEDTVEAVHADGSRLWKSSVREPFDTAGALSVADIDADGLGEVFVNSFVETDGFVVSHVHAFDHRGDPLSDLGFPKTLMGIPSRGAPLVGDLDGDGQKDVLATSMGAPIMAWSADGSATSGFPMLKLSPGLEGGAALADVDQDGDTELMFCNDYYEFHVIDLPGRYDPGLVDWGMARRDPQNSGWVAPAPALDPIAAPTTIKPGERLELRGTASGVGALPLRWAVGTLPEGAYYDDATRTVFWKPTADQAFQTYTFSFLVTDGVRQDSRSASITVVPDAIYAADMETDPNWTFDDGWAWGEPTGQGSWNGDPNSGYTGTNVVGYDLDGDYENNLEVARYATLGPIDATGYRNVRLSFRRWLGVEAPYDDAHVQVSGDGATWVDLWTAGWSHVSDTSWQLVEYAVPAAVGDEQPTLYFRWGLGPTDDSVTYPGWNIDDVQVTGDRIE